MEVERWGKKLRWVRGGFFPQVEWLGDEVENSPPSSVQVKN